MDDDRPPGFDRTRWKDARWSCWSFRNTAAFLPSTQISPSLPPRDLPTGEPWAPEGWGTFLAESHATSAILMVDGKVVAAEPEGAVSDPRPHMLFSITKSIVGLVARMLVDQRIIKTDATAQFYLPALAGTAFGDASLADLLAMRDGVAFDETYADPDADIHSYSRAYWGDAAGGVEARLAALPAAAHRVGFDYRTPVADVMGAMLTAATGQGMAELIGSLLWRPMGAAHAAHFVLDTAGVEIAGAGFNAATSDLARLALLLLDGGAWSGRQVIPEHLVAGLFEGGDRAAFAHGYRARPGWSYRDLWWHMGDSTIAALGVHGQRLIVDRPRRLALMRTGAQPAPDNRPFDALHDAMLNVLHARTPKCPEVAMGDQA